MKVRISIRAAAAALMIAALALRAAMAVDPGPLERHIRGLKAGIYALSGRSFTVRFGNGAIREQFTVTRRGYSYAAFDPTGVKLVQWSRKKTGQILYESWYTQNLPKERLLDDDRSISYTSFYKNGRKWEQYTYNKQKRMKSYDVYDKQGRLVGNP